MHIPIICPTENEFLADYLSIVDNLNVRIESTGKNGDAKVAERDNEDRRPQGRNADVNSTSNRDV